jgi:hypothetical protein
MKGILFTFLLVYPLIAQGFISAENSRATPSPDQTRLLVMLPTGNLSDQTPTATLPDGRTVNLRATFAKSGVYDATTLAPIWQVNWFAQPEDLLLSDDFLHAARRNIFGFHSDWALAFYDRGKLIQSYDCAHLLTHMSNIRCIPFTTCNWHYRWYEDFDLSNDCSQVQLSTVRRRTYLYGHVIDYGFQEHYTFDLVTGSIVNQRTTGLWRISAYAAATLALILLPPIALRLLWQRAKSSTRLRRGFPVG